MAYFLKQSHYPKGLYLQIYESYHDKKQKQVDIDAINHSDTLMI